MRREPYPLIQSAALSAFATLAEEYCYLIQEHEHLEVEAFMRAIHALLPRLYSAGLALPSTDILFAGEEPEEENDDDEEEQPALPPDPDRGDHEEWRTLYGSLGSLMGSRNFYREIFDPYEPVTEPEVTGSLADDLADIYRDVRAGLRKWRRGMSGEALWEWRFHFEGHWGQHATGALRALYVLSSTYEMAWPESSAGAA